ncbi:MAG TPA: hypothetical protein PLP56_08090 [Candidatus Omnitrophota bacterium]|nr:hypothetical protein [Candidatus Omnitrophota bacterium]
MSRGLNRRRTRAMTLMGLMVALVLLGMIVLGIMNLEIFCKHAFTTTDRKTKVMNEATYVIEHMSKHLGAAIGDGNDFPIDDEPAVGGCDRLIRAWTKYNTSAAGKASGDREVAYCFDQNAHTVSFYPKIREWPDTATEDLSKEILSRNTFDWAAAFDDHKNYVNVTVTTCWNAAIECGSVDNPRVKLDTRIIMPSVSVNATP